MSVTIWLSWEVSPLHWHSMKIVAFKSNWQVSNSPIWITAVSKWLPNATVSVIFPVYHEIFLRNDRFEVGFHVFTVLLINSAILVQKGHFPRSWPRFRDRGRFQRLLMHEISSYSLIIPAVTQAFSPISRQFDQLGTSFMDQSMVKTFSLLNAVGILSIHP